MASMSGAREKKREDPQIHRRENGSPTLRVQTEATAAPAARWARGEGMIQRFRETTAVNLVF